jgi:hypothetical protein
MGLYAERRLDPVCAITLSQMLEVKHAPVLVRGEKTGRALCTLLSLRSLARRPVLIGVLNVIVLFLCILARGKSDSIHGHHGSDDDGLTSGAVGAHARRLHRRRAIQSLFRMILQ